MTGGRRVVDTASETILEKAGTPARAVQRPQPPASEIAGATPFDTATSALTVRRRPRLRHANLRHQRRGAHEPSTSTTRLCTAPAVLTVSNDTANHDWGNGCPGSGVNADTSRRASPAPSSRPKQAPTPSASTADDGVRLLGCTGSTADSTGGPWATRPDRLRQRNVNLTAGQRFNVQGRVLRERRRRDHATLRGVSRSASIRAFTGSSARRPRTLHHARQGVRPDAPGGVEANCKQYGTNYKPEGLMQQYAQRCATAPSAT